MTLRIRQRWWIPFLVPLFILPIIITLSGIVIVRGLDFNLWSRRLLGGAIVWFGLIIISSLQIAWKSNRERNAISKLIDGNYWVKWTQYADEPMWRAYIQEQVDKVREVSIFPWKFLSLLAIPFIGVAGLALYYLDMYKDRAFLLQSIILSGGLFASFLVWALAFRWIDRIGAEIVCRRRMKQPIPVVYIGEMGLYHEDKGYTRFNEANQYLTEAHYIPHLHRLTLKINLGSHIFDFTETVYVPSGAEDEARDLEQRLKSEVICRTP